MTAIPEPSKRYSVREGAWQEALRFKWIESQKAGHDLGDEAILRWRRLHMRGFVRAKLIEHLEGVCFWTELHADNYDVLRQVGSEDRELLEIILQRLREGMENLPLLVWAEDNNLPVTRIRKLLERFKINVCHSEYEYHPSPC